MSTIFLITRGVPAVYTYNYELVIIASGSYGRFGYVCNFLKTKTDFIDVNAQKIDTYKILIIFKCFSLNVLTHWGRVTHICVSKLNIIGSNNGLSPGRRQAIIWTNTGILLIWPLGTNFSEMLIEIHIFSFKKMHV